MSVRETPLIVSASRRTDIPAFYADWMMARLRAGWCAVRSPWNADSLSRVDLSPGRVECIVFWTRNFAPMMSDIGEIERLGHRFYVQYTVTGLPKEIEPHVPDADAALRSMRELADRIGPDRVVWRYDPILLTKRTPSEWHVATFRRLSSALSGSVRRCVVSLYDPYAASSRRFQALGQDFLPVDVSGGAETPSLFGAEERAPLDVAPMLRAITDAANDAGMEIHSCAEPLITAGTGILPGACIDASLIERLFGRAGKDAGVSRNVAFAKDPGQRPACRCAPSRDIGEYEACLSGCVYCYATRSFASARRRWERRSPASPTLIPRGSGKEGGNP